MAEPVPEEVSDAEEVSDTVERRRRPRPQTPAPTRAPTRAMTAPATLTSPSDFTKLVPKNSPADPRQPDQLERDDDRRGDERAVVVVPEERERVQDPAEERPDAGDRAAERGAAATGQLAGVGEPLRERHRDRGADRRREAGRERVERLVAHDRDREDRRERRQRAVDQPDHRRLDALEEEVVLVGHRIECSEPMPSD